MLLKLNFETSPPSLDKISFKSIKYTHVQVRLSFSTFSVSTIEMVKSGEELTVHYMMDMENAPDWYLEAWDKHSA